MSRSSATLAPGQVAECPDCHDLANRGASVCESCGAHLFDNEPRGVPFAAGNRYAGQIGWRLCPTDLSELDESGYCDVCGWMASSEAAATAAVAQENQP